MNQDLNERIKTGAPVGVLFLVAFVGQELANALQRPLGLSLSINIGFLFFLVGCIAALRTFDYIQRKYLSPQPQEKKA